MIVTEEDEEVGDGVYVSWHAPDDKIQEEELKVPPAFPSLQDTLPVGTACESVVSAMVAVSVTLPDVVEVELEEIVTEVA